MATQSHVKYDLTGNKLVVDSAAIGSDYLSAGTSRTLTANDYGKTIKMTSLSGSVVTLPAATGTGKGFKFIVTALATTGSHIVKVANTADSMIGMVVIENTGLTNATQTFAASAGTSDTVTLNRTTTGSVTLGEWFQIEDVAASTWAVNGVVTATTTPATVFSATV